MFVEGPRLALRSPERSQAPLFVRWLNEPEVARFIGRVRPLSLAEEEEHLARPASEKDVPLVIWEREPARPVGCCGLHQVDAINRSAELGIVIGEAECRNRGLGGEAMDLLCGFGFQQLNLNRIGLSVYDYNGRGIRCYAKVGFREEGRKREARFWDGKYWDVVQMGILASEWRSRREGAGIPLGALCQAG